MSKFYDFEAEDVMCNMHKMEEYQGKVVLIVNTATRCGFTPQYDDLQNLYDKYQEQGFEILDFPCNQFGNQAPAPTRRSCHSVMQSLESHSSTMQKLT